MADSLKISTVCTSIAALTISITKPDGTTGNLLIRDLPNMRESINQQDCPVLTPRPDNFVTNLRIERDTFGADAAYKTAYYTLNYTFYFYPVHAGAGLFEKYGAMVTAAAVMLTYLATHTNLTGTTDIMPEAQTSFGIQLDVAQTAFHGCEVALNVEQFLEV